MNLEIAAYWGLWRAKGRTREAHVFWVNDKAIGTRVSDVLEYVRAELGANAPQRKVINEMCDLTKSNGFPSRLEQTAEGWKKVK